MSNGVSLELLSRDKRNLLRYDEYTGDKVVFAVFIESKDSIISFIVFGSLTRHDFIRFSASISFLYSLIRSATRLTS